MNVRANTSAIKAIASSLIERYLFRYASLITGALIICWVVSVILTITHSEWWFTLTVLLIPLLIITGVIVVVSYVVSTRLRPRKLSRAESKQINSFVSEFGIKAITAKGVKKNPAALSGIIAWKYLKSGGKQPISGILMEPINDVKTIKSDFQKIVALFE